MNRYPEGLPCWAPGAADYLASLLAGTEIVFEWGSGASTVWLSDKVERLYTMEHDKKWLAKVMEIRGPVVLPFHQAISDPEYVTTALRVMHPDVWLIDGYRRIDCLALVMEHKRKGDIIVCDDALDYAEHLLTDDIKRFAMPHPYAGTKINQAQHKGHGNTNRTHHAATKETWIWRV